MRVVVITGAASGIGAATARAFAQRGDAVALGDVDEVSIDALAQEVRGAGGNALAVAGDVSRPGAVASLVAAAEAEWGAVHAACNCAGISGPTAEVTDIELDAFERTLAVNLGGVLLSMQAELPAIARAGGGAIVNVSSVAGLIGVPTMGAYTASKHAVVGLTRSAALEWARRGVRVNALCPGTVRTPMLRAHVGGDEDLLEQAGRHGSPMGRLAEPEEIASAAVWLCSPDAGYVTGHAMAVDGGAAAT